MKKILRFASFVLFVMLLFYAGMLLADKYTLRNNVIRLHVVANSDDVSDQNIKIKVKDAVLDYIAKDIPQTDNVADAKRHLIDRLPNIQEIANKMLTACGSSDRATVTLCQEKFGLRQYETFSLPSGIYESLRIEIGNAAGKNWWCVVFPSLCVPTTSDDFVDAAVTSGFDPVLADTLADNETYEVRFFLLDCLGKLEKFFAFS